MSNILPTILAFGAAIAVVLSLVAGLDTMAHGGDLEHDRSSARWMGWRVALQLFAVIFIAAAVLVHFVTTYL